MNQGFRLRYDDFRDNDPSSAVKKNETDRADIYTSTSYARSVCFVWLDGRKALLNYAYFTAAEFEVSQDKNWIKLEFSGASVMIGGYQLEPLFMMFLEHIPRIIQVVDPRYSLIENEDAPMVTEVLLERK